MLPNEFRKILQALQKDPYRWPNDYYAWEKPDKTLFIVGINSTRFYDLLKYSYNSFFKSYGVTAHSISPTASDYLSERLSYDPIEKLVEEISGYRYLGAWHDPDIFVKDPHGERMIACGRWELAKQNIPQIAEKEPLAAQLSSANDQLAHKSGRHRSRGGESKQKEIR